LYLKKRLFEEIRNKMADISQMNMEEMIREYGEEEAVRLMKVIMENNITMLKLQKQILELQMVAEEKKKDQRRRQEDREQMRREYEEKREEKEQRRQKEKKEEEEKKRVDEEQRKSGDDKRCGKERGKKINRE